MSEDERTNDSAISDEDENGPQPWAKTSASTESLAADDDAEDEGED
jgi:hypothetical protein